MIDAAVIGVGQTKYDSKRRDVSVGGLVREAIDNAMKHANVDWDAIDAVILGKAPDMFEGIMMPELSLADAIGAVGKPVLRVHTAGSVGGSTSVIAATHVTSGNFDTVLTVTFEKQSESNATWALSPKYPYSPHINAGAGGYFAPYMREYIRRYNAPENIGWIVAAKDRQNALKNPYAHLQIPNIDEKMVADTPMLWEPLRYLESCPSSDGACALVISNEKLAKGRKAAWIKGMAVRSEGTLSAGRDEVNPQGGQDCASDIYKQAGILNPKDEIDCAEIYVPFSWYEPMWLENLHFCDLGEGWKLTENGTTALDGDLPINMSGGVLSSNPIGASGMIRFGEAALQVMHQANEYQVDGAKLAMGHAYGGISVFCDVGLLVTRGKYGYKSRNF
ncbi:MAG: putative lipid carrier protein or keto acyl-COA thiolase [Gammaproteobacteria bacterium]|nr:MAG: putative lipid carrier protein or keto acyl-COA thiolase [Gammaproteobacteria bacterium]